MKKIPQLRTVYTATVVAALLTFLSGCGWFQKVVEVAWPLLDTYKMENLQLQLAYTASGTAYDKTGTTGKFPNSLLDFGTGTVTMGNANYDYRHEKVNGVKKVVFEDQSTHEDIIAFAYTLDGKALTLTSDNFLTGSSARERAQEAIGWAALFGFGTPSFPKINVATDASSGALIVNATK